MNLSTKPRAVVLLSGGLDSATCLAIANQHYDCYALSFAYGQRHNSELLAAQRIAQALGVCEHRIISIDLAGIGGSALTDLSIAVPEQASEGIPVTYVPARNTIFLAYALGFAEVIGAQHIVIGVNAVDYSGYPDCRPEYIAAFQHLADLATKSGVEGQSLRIETPLLHLSKADIIQTGIQLGVDYSLTVSCYQADTEGRACGKCDSCRLRKEGFASAQCPDPTHYQ
ncbi:7-cyano-7-deazaguanine synthase QueC [Agitococcus lubricus]|uniref:7-cyano-7-deazaguanine synthase n=1 Tax=Agitococcus lubricus TaxID=1077255 RepID=A0A2T5IWI1_9GAMM|nr:7-cyano-7-deazaguanine synthase QueC [Agitococcus lubricus]PTQ88261.1 preQ(0) biosynthesis protein QueC [Agitococcus lubricus]